MPGASPSNRTPVFVRIAIRLLLTLVVLAVVIGLLGMYSAESINRSGGWGWLLIGGLYVAVATVVCFACVILSAISLVKREGHTRLAAAILVGCSLEVLIFRGSVTVLTRTFEPDPNEAIVRADAELASALSQHFAVANVIVKPGDRTGGFQGRWLLESTDVGSQCLVLLTFRHFPDGMSLDAMRKAIAGYTVPPLLNEQAALAMFPPQAQGTTANRDDCRAWSGKSTEVTDRLGEIFMTFQPPRALTTR